MNSQKQITLMVMLVFLLLGGCAAYTVYDQNRENSAAAFQTEKLAERGARIFARYCRFCHGNDGTGRMGSPAPMLNREELRNPNTRAENVQLVTDTITCGRIGTIMPAWAIREGGALNDEQIKDLVTLITTGGNQSGQGGHGWEKAAEFSEEENKAASPPGLTPIEDVLKAAAITGSSGRVCGQKAATVSTPAASNGQLPAGLTPTNTWTENATDNKFDVTAMAVNAGQAATVTFNNKGAAVHNWEVLDSSGAAVLKDDSGKPISVPLTNGGASASITFTLSTPGVYNFRCQVHPTEMTGQLYVVGANGQASTAPATPGAAAASPAPADNSPTEVTTDNKFSVTNITVTGGQQVTLKIQNNGQALHNFDVLNVTDDSGKPIKTDFGNPGQTITYTFTISKKGTYNFQCDVHPTEMTGTFTVQ